jgi:hypothetical protein
MSFETTPRGDREQAQTTEADERSTVLQLGRERKFVARN